MKEIALKKFTSNADRHSSGVLSEIRLTGVRVPWFMTTPSTRENAFTARPTALGPTYLSNMSIKYGVVGKNERKD